MLDVGAPDRVGAFLVQLVSVEAADVVRLEHLRVEHRPIVWNRPAGSGVEVVRLVKEAPMRILVAGVAAVTAALAFSTPAVAKEPKEATLCGPDECATLTDRSLLLGVMQDGAAGPPPSPGPYYRLTVSFEAPGHEARFSFWYVPGSPMYRPADTDYPPADWIALRP